jgi:hypothetical protein
MSDKVDLFAPPTKEELNSSNDDIFAPPSEAELSTISPEVQTSIPEAALSGAVEGLTLSLDDEILGALTAPVASVMSDKPLSLDELLNQYRTSRDRRREQKAQIAKDRPGTVLAANLAGGIAPALFTGGSSLLATGAKALAPTTIKGMAALGGLAGLGASEADLTKGEISQAAIDTALGAGTGAILGKVAPKAGKAPIIGGVAGAGIGATSAALDENATAEDMLNRTLTGGVLGAGAGMLAGIPGAIDDVTKLSNLIPDKLAKSYKLGKQGDLTGTKEFYNKTLKQVDDAAKEAADPIVKEQLKQQKFAQESADLFEKQKQETIDTFQNQIDDLLKKQDEFKAIEQSKIEGIKTENLNKLANKQLELADNINNTVSKVEKDVIDNINQVYKVADEHGIVINTIDTVQNFKDSLPENTLSKKDIEKLNQYTGAVSLEKVRELKNLIYRYTKSSDKTLSQNAREIYFNLIDDVAGQMDNQGHKPLSDTLRLNNQKYKLLQDFNDDFINFKEGDVKANEAINLLKQFEASQADVTSNTTSKAQAQSNIDKLLAKLEKVNPEAAANLKTTGSQFAEQSIEAKALQPKIEIPTNEFQPKIDTLQQQLKQVKASKYVPEVNKAQELFKGFSDEENNLLNQLRPLVTKIEQQKGNPNTEAQIQSLMTDMTKTMGEEKTQVMFNKMKDIAENVNLAGIEDVLDDVPNGPSTYALIKAFKNVLPRMANIVGYAQTKAKNVVQTKSDALISNLGLDQALQKVATGNDNVSKTLNRMLSTIKSIPDKKKQDAAMFALMQNPVYREKLNQEQKK